MKDKRYWLIKTDPEVFSIKNLRKEGQTPWDGIRNPQARNYIYKEMSIGDGILFYHSTTRRSQPAIVGIATVASEAIVDPTAFDKSGLYYDRDSSRDNPRWYMVEVRYESEFEQPILLDELRHVPELATMRLLKPGQRLTIQPVSEIEWKTILSMRPELVKPE